MSGPKQNGNAPARNVASARGHGLPNHASGTPLHIQVRETIRRQVREGELIVDSGQKLTEMIQGLLAFSRLNTVPRVSTVCDLEIVMARCYMEAQPRLDATKGLLNYPRMPEITADPARMFTLFYAVIDNALKFRRDDAAPDIRIQVEEKPDCWLFRVSDNGVGIDPMFYDDVFRPLRKLHTDDAYPGVGMGLTLARKIVIQHGGQIWLEPSGRGGGLMVAFTLTKAS